MLCSYRLLYLLDCLFYLVPIAASALLETHEVLPLGSELGIDKFFNKLECHILQQLFLYFGVEITFILAKTKL